jgi:alpha-tubulin suppressor-like RCC1 family protein
LRPVEVGKSQVWASVNAGVSHTCAVTSTHLLFCWGANDHGQLGDGTHTRRLTPTQVGADTWDLIETGGYFTCGIKATRFLFCWGINDHGQTGHPAGGDVVAPSPVEDHTWSDISSGLDHTCGTRPEHTLWCWGNNRFGDLGNGQVGGEEDAPAQVPFQTGDPWLNVDVYDDRTCARKAFMLCFGNDAYGQLGDGSPTPYRLMPAPILIVPR